MCRRCAHWCRVRAARGESTPPRSCAQLESHAGIRTALNRYLYVFLAQLMQTATCTRFHLVEARLARWLLMTRDRAHSSQFHVTHEFLAYMLGVRRVGVTSAASALQRRKLIRYSRGDISILDVRGLEQAACPCYAIDKKIYSRLFRARSATQQRSRCGAANGRDETRRRDRLGDLLLNYAASPGRRESDSAMSPKDMALGDSEFA